MRLLRRYKTFVVSHDHAIRSMARSLAAVFRDVTEMRDPLRNLSFASQSLCLAFATQTFTGLSNIFAVIGPFSKTNAFANAFTNAAHVIMHRRTRFQLLKAGLHGGTLASILRQLSLVVHSRWNMSLQTWNIKCTIEPMFL